MCWSDTTYIIPDRSDISKFWCDIMRRNDITYIVPGWCDISYITPHRCHVPQKTSMGFEPGTPWLVYLTSHDWATRAGCYFYQWSGLWTCQFTNRSDINTFWSDITQGNDITYIIPKRSDINKIWSDITQRSDITYIIPERNDINKFWSDITWGSDIRFGYTQLAVVMI